MNMYLSAKQRILQHTFIFGEMGELGLRIGSESMDSVSLLGFMSFSMIQRSSNNASKSTSPLPVNRVRVLHISAPQWHLLITNCVMEGTVFSTCNFHFRSWLIARRETTPTSQPAKLWNNISTRHKIDRKFRALKTPAEIHVNRVPGDWMKWITKAGLSYM